MEWKWLWVVLVVFLLGGRCECEGCWEHEKTALLQLKPFFSHIEDVKKYWVEGNQSWDCCKWPSVECNNSTGRVIQLFLNLTYAEVQDMIYISYAYVNHNWHLNASLFLPFEELKSLYLSRNSIVGCVENQGFDRLSSKLDKLEILDLSSNYFSNNILASLSELPSLKSLNLRSNQFTISNPFDGIKWLSKLNKLETLDLSGNTLLGNNLLSHLAGFTSLKILSLQDCGLKETVDMLEFNNLKNLKELYLDQNEIESLGSLHQDKGELRFTKLEVLGLSDNLFDNSIFSSLAALSNLKSLYIGNNKLKGAIHIEELNALSNLEELYMQGNEVNEFDQSQDNEMELRLMNLEVLDLTENSFNSSTLPSLSSLSNLKSLYLDLEGNKLEGSIDLKGSHALRNLEELYISCSFTEGTACSLPLQSLGMLTSLKILSLKGFSFNGTKTTQKLHPLRNLEHLRIGCNFVKGIVCSLPLQSLDKFPSLKTLSLYGFNFSEAMTTTKLHPLRNLKDLDISCSFAEGIVCSLPLQSLDKFPSLKTLSLYGFNFSEAMTTTRWQNLTSLEMLRVEDSSLPSDFIQGIGILTSLKNLFCELRQLQRLYFSYNNLKAKLPECFFNLTSLEYLDLSSNQFYGNIDGLKSLTSLRELKLSDNNFQIPISLGPLFNLSKLEKIYADNNAIYAETERHSLAPTFQLRSISLSCCGDVGSFPQFLYHQHDLQDVDLSNVYFKEDQFPNWLLENNKNLETLNLANCSPVGPFQLSLASHLSLSNLDISKNSFYGNIPEDIGEKLPSLVFLNMSNNYFDGRIPASVGDMSSLTAIILANNLLEGPIPKEFCQLNVNLRLLDLSMNNICGNFPPCFKPRWISQVHLSRNNLEGPFPNAFLNSTILVTLDLSHNHLNGSIPNWIGTLSQLSYLLLNNNQFGGGIPVRLCKLDHLSILDLSTNNLSGTIPHCLKITTLNDIIAGYHGNYDVVSIKGAAGSLFTKEPIEFTTKTMSYNYSRRVLTYLSGIDLSCNKLTGEIPHEVKNLQNIIVLNLSHNNLIGPIPPTLSDLEQIESLDLSYNNLSGKIPSQLVQLHFLSFFSVAFNNLSGSTPQRVAQFATFENNSYLGNPFLCGTPLQKNCSIDGPTSSMPKTSTDDGFIDMNFFYVSFVASYIIAVLTVAIFLYINPFWRQALFYRIEVGISSCYYFVVDNILPKRFH